jgi:hypothetical protein
MKYQSLENLPFKGLLLLLSFLSITVANVQAADNGCQVLQDKVHGWSVRASAPGNYCLAADLKQTETPAMLRLPHQPGPVDPLLTIASANVAVDLGQHALFGKRSSGLGLWLNGGRDMRYFPADVRNGTIRTEEQPAVFMVYAWNRRNKRFSENSAAAGLAVANSIDEYVTTRFVLEDLTLEASKIAVILQGRNNVIRRCKIIGGNGAVNLHGPDLVFEDNEIVMNAREPKANDEAPVALYLEDSSNSVVRNNRIIIRGRVVGAEAIVLKNSSNVTLQNNSVNGGPQTHKLLDQRSSLR